MTLTSAQAEAALAAAEADYSDNADYDTFPNAAGVVKARAFVAACRRIIQLQPSTMQKGPNGVGYRVDLLQNEIKSAYEFIKQFATDARPGQRVTYADFSEFRRR